jgi:hypothetical protein
MRRKLAFGLDGAFAAPGRRRLGNLIPFPAAAPVHLTKGMVCAI